MTSPLASQAILFITTFSILGSYYIGKTKVFLRYWQADELAAAVQRMHTSATQIQAVVRGFYGRCHTVIQQSQVISTKREVAKLFKSLEEHASVRN